MVALSEEVEYSDCLTLSECRLFLGQFLRSKQQREDGGTLAKLFFCEWYRALLRPNLVSVCVRDHVLLDHVSWPVGKACSSRISSGNTFNY